MHVLYAGSSRLRVYGGCCRQVVFEESGLDGVAGCQAPGCVEAGLAGCGGGWLWLFLAVLVVVGVGACPFCLDTLIPAFELGRAR